MSRGRKPKSNDSNFNWKQIFNKNVGKYLECIIVELSKAENSNKETGFELLKAIKVERANLIKEKKIKKGIEHSVLKTNEIPFEIAKNWVWCKLGEIGICLTGTTPSTAVKEYFGNDIPFIKPADITLNGLVCDNEGLSFLGLKQGVLVPANSLMMVCIGGSIGKSFYSHIDVSCNQQINTITPLSGISAKFLQYLMQSDYFQKAIWAKASGGTTPIVNRSKWESIPIPLPPLSEQSQIVSFLTDFENENLKEDSHYFNREVEQKVIELHEAQLKGIEISAELNHQLTLVKKLRQQLLQDAVQGKLVEQNPNDEPASELLKKIKAEKEKLIAEKKLKKEKELPPIKPEEIPFEIPENWVWCRLGEICTKIGSGSTPQGSNYSSNGKPFFRSQNIYDIGLVYEDIKFISDEVHEQMNGTTVYASDILLNITGGSMGRCALVPVDFKEGNVSQHVCIIRPHLVDNNFYHSIILSPFFQKFIFSSTTGAGREGLPKYNLEQFIIPLPPLVEQNSIVQKLNELILYCNELEASIKQSESQNEKLLQQVLREALRKEVVEVL